MIGFSDLVDLWVIKIKPMNLCARSTSRSREQTQEMKQREHMKGSLILFAYSKHSQNNKTIRS